MERPQTRSHRHEVDMIGTPEIQVRLANQRYIDAVSALLEAQFREHQMTPPAEALRASIRSVIDDPRHGFILLAAGPGNVGVGVAYASSLLSFEHGGVSGWVEELYVIPPLRGQGIGSCVLKRVISMAKELGWRALDLEVDTNHERAIALYGRHHFLPHSRQPVLSDVYRRFSYRRERRQHEVTCLLPRSG